jgi:hypothetical protein
MEIKKSQLAICFFGASFKKDVQYPCLFCKEKVREIKYCGAGYGNFTNHIYSQHKDYEQIFKQWQASKSGVITAFLTEKALARCKDIEHWMKWSSLRNNLVILSNKNTIQ